MRIDKLPGNHAAATMNRTVERIANRAIRSYDRALRFARLGGRKARYDDTQGEFEGGPSLRMRKKHYDKSLRLLWKAEVHAPYLAFQDGSAVDRHLRDIADKNMSEKERAICDTIGLPEFRAMLDEEYTQREKEAIVSILSALVHGEAYAWMVSAELLTEVRSTGAKAALTMQTFEEAKHFVVLRELIKAFDVPVTRLSAWEYMLLESVYKARGLDKLFGMNILVEGIALSIFGALSTMPGLEILKQFHLDEARHMGLPSNYLREFPLSLWQRHNPVARARRLKMLMPAIALIPLLEEDLAELGIDAFELAASTLRKLTLVAERNGFHLPIPRGALIAVLDALFNTYCNATREGHEARTYRESETTLGAEELQAEAEIWAALA